MRDFLGNIPKSSSEIFFRKVKFWDGGHDGEAPPVFNADGITYFHVKSGGVMLVATTKANVSPAMVLELLVRMGSIIKDHIGVLSEEAIRKNFVIVYELLDEAIDYGYPQNASTESLKTFVLNEPSVVASPGMRSASSLFSTPGRHPGVVKSVLDNMKTEATGRKEIFVDVVEKVNVTFSAAGTMHASEVQGSIQVKNYLGHNPPVKIALSSNLLIGRQNTQLGGGWLDSGSPVQLDDCNFNGSCDLSTFEVDRTLQLTPPDGEFAIMNYRSTKDFRPPFRIYTSVEEMSAYKVEVLVKLRAEFPQDKKASSLQVKIPMPPLTNKVHHDLDQTTRGCKSQTGEYLEREKAFMWNLADLVGGTERMLQMRVTLTQAASSVTCKEFGPISLSFVIPMYTPSGLQVRYLQILEDYDKKDKPYRWVRYLTQSNSYVFRT
eukprot:CAMPEP_0177604022 /NCGR_PEP_ID=MMETSP0419_2-20121207/15878_1 /TAXON_ID=582737 /ORGANISM="Tetraselmis sp., Strain GSL018" /LENGTH=434 /DNA_ID=CAMNT_0019097941 /DNA_START=641 /DNA_END=1945 /DNA_ORIENTATION=-